jgi:hypothetical protein
VCLFLLCPHLLTSLFPLLFSLSLSLLFFSFLKGSKYGKILTFFIPVLFLVYAGFLINTFVNRPIIRSSSVLPYSAIAAKGSPFSLLRLCCCFSLVVPLLLFCCLLQV